MRNFLKKINILFVLLIILFFILHGCTEDDPKKHTGPPDKITLGVSKPDYAPFFAFLLLAKELGLYKEHGLDVTYEFYPHGVGCLQALQRGDVDMATGAEFPFVRQSHEDNSMNIIASIAQVNVLHLIARKDSGILIPADLKGKRVALIMESQLEFCLDRFLLKQGLTIRDIETLDLLPPEMRKSFLDGTADAIVFREPMISKVKAALGDNWVSWPVQNQQNVFWIIAGKDTYINQNPKKIERFLRTIREAELFYLGNTQDALDIIVQKGKLNRDEFNLMFPTIDYKLNLEQALIIAMEDEARWHIENQYSSITQVPNFLDSIYIEALKTVSPDAVSIIH